MVMNDFLMQMLNAGQINLIELLENGSFPFSDKLIQSVKMRRQQETQAAMGGQAPVVPEDISRQIQTGTNPVIQQMLNSNNPLQ
jgi:hypothetical protein